MTPRSRSIVVPPRRAGQAAKRTKLKPQNPSVEHLVYGIGNLLHVRPLDDGGYAAVMNFAGVERTIRLAAPYWITPIAEIMKVASHLAPPPAVKLVVKVKGSEEPDEADEEAEQVEEFA